MLPRFASQFVEAGWLAAIVLLPLALNPIHGTAYEAPKARLLFILVIVMALGWVVRARGEGSAGAEWRRLRRIPWLLAVGLFLLSAILSTLLSVAPGLSFRGGFERSQGLLTLLALVAFFAFVALGLRERAQAERLIACLLLTSLPVALYAIAQYFQLDPLRGVVLPKALRFEHQVISTLGQHIFLGAYLALLIPFTLVRWLEALTDLSERRAPAAPWAPPRSGILWAALALLMTGAGWLFLVQAGHEGKRSLWWGAEGLLVGLWLLALLLARREPRRTAPTTRMLGYGLLLVIQAVALLLSQARGPWLGALAGGWSLLFLFLTRRRGRRGLRAFLALSALALLGLVVLNLPGSPLSGLRELPLLDRLGRLVETEGAGRFRLRVWATSLEIFRQHPVLGDGDSANLARPLVGYGPETFLFPFERLMPVVMGAGDEWRPRVDQAHNQLLHLLVTQGLLGLASYLVLFALVLASVLRALRSAPPGEIWMPLALVGALITHLVQLQTGIEVIETAILFWTVLALAAAVARGAEPRTESGAEARAWPARAAAAYLVVTLAALWLLARPLNRDVIALPLTLGTLWLLVGLAIGAALLPSRAPASPWRPRAALPTLLIGGAAAAGLCLLSLVGDAAGISFLFGREMVRDRRWLESVPHFQRAIRLDPAREHPYIALSDSLMRVADGAPPDPAWTPSASRDDALTATPESLRPRSRQALMSLGARTMEEAWRVAPLDPAIGFYLAKTAEIQSVSGDPRRLRAALDLYPTVSRMSPRRPFIYHHWALALSGAGRVDDALLVLGRGDALNESLNRERALFLATHAFLRYRLGETEAARDLIRRAYAVVDQRRWPQPEYTKRFFEDLGHQVPALSRGAVGAN